VALCAEALASARSDGEHRYDGPVLAWDSALAGSCRQQALRQGSETYYGAAGAGTSERAIGNSSQSSGAPVISRGLRMVLPVKRRMVARSTRRSTVAMAWASEGKSFFHWVKPVLAVMMVELCW